MAISAMKKTAKMRLVRKIEISRVCDLCFLCKFIREGKGKKYATTCYVILTVINLPFNPIASFLM